MSNSKTHNIQEINIRVLFHASYSCSVKNSGHYPSSRATVRVRGIANLDYLIDSVCLQSFFLVLVNRVNCLNLIKFLRVRNGFLCAMLDLVLIVPSPVVSGSPVVLLIPESDLYFPLLLARRPKHESISHRLTKAGGIYLGPRISMTHTNHRKCFNGSRVRNIFLLPFIAPSSRRRLPFSLATHPMRTRTSPLRCPNSTISFRTPLSLWHIPNFCP